MKKSDGQAALSGVLLSGRIGFDFLFLLGSRPFKPLWLYASAVTELPSLLCSVERFGPHHSVLVLFPCQWDGPGVIHILPVHITESQ